MKLSDFPINNFFQTAFFIRKQNQVSNSFISSKKNSKFLQEIMKKIEVSDFKIKDMPTQTKLVNKVPMIIYNTGPNTISNTLTEFDENNFHLIEKRTKIASLCSLNSIVSSWYNSHWIKEKEAIKNVSELKALFWSDKNETKNYFKHFYLPQKELQKLNIKEELEEER